MNQSILVVGAGFSGAVIARELANNGHQVTICDARSNVGGNCHTERDKQSGVMVHRYGPHIFHTTDTEIWEYVSQFTTMKPYRHSVRTTVQSSVYSLPINLQTINQFFGKTFNSDEARAFLADQCEDFQAPQNFEQAALASIGRPLYEAFFRGYTIKQWGCDPTEIPAQVFARLPVRFNYDDRYFDHRLVGIPADGYTALIQNILDHPQIDLQLNTTCTAQDISDYDHCFWTGTIDSYFNFIHGRLGYRTLSFEMARKAGDWQGCAVMNYGDISAPYTRVTEHKHLAPWEDHNETVISIETSKACGPTDTPYYPTRKLSERDQLKSYVDMAKAAPNVTFAGRLGTYRYLNMDTCIRAAIDIVAAYCSAVTSGSPSPNFATDPL
ncbi:UDP-galactopyranose mutase [Marivivens niveibacter]|uniref:UDP-galactopyranose mutase n=1 Tax=Marivivens niveibacter TaxID=1930667 RepID=A0A251WVX0_9RHOB|nr:UDP-galactopyranose mutase [Marivivens niveibacter]OUD08268.1 UDP-galactopyranose mutase [Marivivens niveibacter]